MKTKNKELILIYNASKQRDKEVLGYAQSIESHKLNEQDISSNNLTERQIADMAIAMDVSINDLLDKNDEKYMSEVKPGQFSDEELLKLMVANPELLKTPIARMNDKTFVVKSQYSFVNEGLEIEGVKSSEGNKFEK